MPVRRTPDGQLRGVEAVVDKDSTTALLAENLEADALLLLTDVPAVELDYGKPNARSIDRISASELERMRFPSGSMGPKVAAACRFVRGTQQGCGHWPAGGRRQTAGRQRRNHDLRQDPPGGS